MKVRDFFVSAMNTVHEMHLYTEQWEAIGKAGVFIISMFFGVYPLSQSEENYIKGSAYFVFCLSLLVEYIPPLIKQKLSFASKILPIVLVCVSMLILTGSSAFIGNRPVVDVEWLDKLGFIAIGIIAIDAIVVLGSPARPQTMDKVEDRLKQIVVG